MWRSHVRSLGWDLISPELWLLLRDCFSLICWEVSLNRVEQSFQSLSPDSFTCSLTNELVFRLEKSLISKRARCVNHDELIGIEKTSTLQGSSQSYHRCFEHPKHERHEQHSEKYFSLNLLSSSLNLLSTWLLSVVLKVFEHFVPWNFFLLSNYSDNGEAEKWT